MEQILKHWLVGSKNIIVMSVSFLVDWLGIMVSLMVIIMSIEVSLWLVVV